MTKRAFTLVEITVALLILVVGLIGILALFPVGFDASGRASRMTEATFLAQGVMEDLKREGYDGVIFGTTGPTQFPAPYANYVHTIIVTDGIPDPPNPRKFIGQACEVIVTVSWSSGTRSVDLTTFLVDYGS